MNTARKFKMLAFILSIALMFTMAFGLLAGCSPDDGKITVSFNLNYNGAPTAPQPKEVVKGEKYGNLPSVSRSGYTFIGWYKNSNGTGSAVTADSTVEETANHTLYAKWNAANKVSVSFIVNGETIETVEYDAGTNYGLDIPDAPANITVSDELLNFQYWYVLIDDEESAIDAYTPLAFDEDHNVYAFYAVTKSVWDFTAANDPDIQYYRLGAQYGSSLANQERDASTVQYDDNKKALRLSPVDDDVRLITSKMTYDFEYNWVVTYTVEVECAAADNNKDLKFSLIAKFGGGPDASIHDTLLDSTVVETITNGETYTISGRTNRDGDTELYLQIEGIENIANRTALRFYIKRFEIDRNPGPYPTAVVYDMSTAAGRELLAIGNQWTEYVGGGGGENTSVQTDLVKNAVKVSTAIEDAGILWVRVFWFHTAYWVDTGTQVSWEIEIDAPEDTVKKVKFYLRGSANTGSSWETFSNILSVDFADGTHTISAITTGNYNRHYLAIDVSELSQAERTTAVFYIKKVIVDTNPPQD